MIIFKYVSTSKKIDIQRERHKYVLNMYVNKNYGVSLCNMRRTEENEEQHTIPDRGNHTLYSIVCGHSLILYSRSFFLFCMKLLG